MKNFHTIIFVILVTGLCLQGIRHVNLYVFGVEESILAPFDEFYGMKRDIRVEGSTNELLAEYESSKAEIERIIDADPSRPRHELHREHQEAFERNQALSEELRQREMRRLELRDVWYFSIAGYLLVVLGVVIFSRGFTWVGTSLVLPGLLELVWWSSPSFSLGGALREYEALLISKIILTAIALAIAFTLWILAQRWWRNQTPE